MRQALLQLDIPELPPGLVFGTLRRVVRGRRLLSTKKLPNEGTRVVEATLDIRRDAHCKLGQLYDSYKAGCCELGLDYNSNEPAKFGFNVLNLKGRTDREVQLEFEILRRGWILVAQKYSSLKKIHPVRFPIAA